jgi:hypothetical protein
VPRPVELQDLNSSVCLGIAANLKRAMTLHVMRLGTVQYRITETKYSQYLQE